MKSKPTEKQILENWEDYALSDKFRHHRKRKRSHEEHIKLKDKK